MRFSDLPCSSDLLVSIDRFMSEARALTSVISNACAVIWVSMWERACNRARLKNALSLAHEPEETFDQPVDLPGWIVRSSQCAATESSPVDVTSGCTAGDAR